MPVTFRHAAHVATVWLPELSPTRATMISALIALLFCAALIGVIAWMFAAMCLERPHPARFGALSTLAVLAIIAAVPGIRHHVSGATTPPSASASPDRARALSAARAAAVPASAWHVGARETAAPTSTRLTWSDDDLRTLSVAAQKMSSLRATYPDSRISVDSSSMSAADIAAHGTGYLTADGKRVRCVAHVRDVRKNNVGQPLSATLNDVACRPAA